MQPKTPILTLRGGFLKYDPACDEFRYLGYPLTLTRTERKILARLMACSEEYCAPKLLCEGILDLSADPKGLLRAHISHINEKAFAIGERRLIVSRKNIGYKISFSL